MISVYMKHVNPHIPGTIFRYDLILVSYTMSLHEETTIYHNHAVGSTGTPALFYAQDDAPNRMTPLTSTRYQVLL